jgi:hypothetical protein
LNAMKSVRFSACANKIQNRDEASAMTIDSNNDDMESHQRCLLQSVIGGTLLELGSRHQNKLMIERVHSVK